MVSGPTSLSLTLPIFLPSVYLVENFDVFLQVFGWFELEYGAVHLRLPKRRTVLGGRQLRMER